MLNLNSLLKNYRVELILFSCLWTYVILRSFLIFYIHDELVTKYAYMINWNFLPYHGYVDANNHFLNSFLGGFFIRLFQSDAIWVVRLANVLSFPLFFWSIVTLKKYFTSKSNYYFLLLSIACTAYFLDFFSLARGYGISWAFLLFALSQSFAYLKSPNNLRAIAILISWILCTYANLSYLVVAIFGIAYLALFALKKGNYLITFIFLLSFFPFYYFIQYALNLQSIDKLYLGDSKGFVDTTIHSLSNFIFGYENSFIDIIILCAFIFILTITFIKLIKTKSIFQPNSLFQLFLFISVLAIITQHYLLEINFPTGRAAVHLAFFFLGSMAFSFDYLKLKSVGWVLSIASLILFISQINFTHTRGYFYEHFDERLLSKIPLITNGIPSSTGGRFWQMDNELAKVKGYPIRVFQDIRSQKRLLQDYLVQLADIKEERPEVQELYEEVYVDPISKLTLFKRKQLLNREKILENEIELNGDQTYFSLIKKHPSIPCFIRCKGRFESASISDIASIVFVAENSQTREIHSYGGLNPVTSTSINADKSISFDFTYTINNYEETDQISVYVWNRGKKHLKGNVKVELYEIEL